MCLHLSFGNLIALKGMQKCSYDKTAVYSQGKFFFLSDKEVKTFISSVMFLKYLKIFFNIII